MVNIQLAMYGESQFDISTYYNDGYTSADIDVMLSCDRVLDLIDDMCCEFDMLPPDKRERLVDLAQVIISMETIRCKEAEGDLP